MKDRFFIVNSFDRPCPRHIAEKRKDGKLYYIHPELRHQKMFWGMDASEATPLEDFGISFEISNGFFKGHLTSNSMAKYPNGKSCMWQGDSVFVFPYE